MKANHWLYQLSVHHRTALNVWSVTSNRSVTLQGIGNASPRPAPTPTESDLWDQNPRSSFSNFAWKSRCWHWSLKRTTLVWYVFQYTHVSNLTLYTLNLNNVIYVDYISIKLGGKKTATVFDDNSLLLLPCRLQGASYFFWEYSTFYIL